MTTIKKSVTFDEEDHNKIMRIKKEHGTSLSETVRRALREYWKKQK